MFKGQSLCTNVTVFKIDFLHFSNLQQILESVLFGDKIYIKYTTVLLNQYVICLDLIYMFY